MGNTQSSFVIREAIPCAALLFAITRHLQKVIDRDTQTNAQGKVCRSPSSARLDRAAQLDRSTPRSLRQVARNFAHCWVCCALLDVCFARRTKARWFTLHALANAVITAMATPDLLKALREPKDSMEGKCSVVPATLIPSLFIYHLSAFSNVPKDEWVHHCLFGGVIATAGLYYCPGPLQNALAFFICGLPGGIDYAMLAAVRQGAMRPVTEKVLNTWLNVWLRSPGLVLVGYIIYVACKYGRSKMPNNVAAIVALLSAFNGNYYMQRVVASAALNNWRPS